MNIIDESLRLSQSAMPPSSLTNENNQPNMP